MQKYNKSISFDAKDETEAISVVVAITTILNSIEDKKNLIELGAIVAKKPGLIQKGIPYLKLL